MLYIHVWLKDPSGNTIYSEDDLTYSINLQVDFTVQAPVSGLYTCYAKYQVDGSTIDQLQQSKQIYTLPTGETTIGNAWSGLIPTAYKWRGRLSGGNFVGRKVQEMEGGNDVDTCWWPGSAYSSATGLSGGEWDVESNGAHSEYGDDTIGIHWLTVDYYRGAGRAPCQFETDQIMQIDRPGASWASYKTNRLKMGMTATTVWSYRDGQVVSKNY